MALATRCSFDRPGLWVPRIGAVFIAGCQGPLSIPWCHTATPWIWVQKFLSYYIFIFLLSLAVYRAISRKEAFHSSIPFSSTICMNSSTTTTTTTDWLQRAAYRNAGPAAHHGHSSAFPGIFARTRSSEWSFAAFEWEKPQKSVRKWHACRSGRNTFAVCVEKRRTQNVGVGTRFGLSLLPMTTSNALGSMLNVNVNCH